jgi:hypothetical protein
MLSFSTNFPLMRTPASDTSVAFSTILDSVAFLKTLGDRFTHQDRAPLRAFRLLAKDSYV